MQGIDSSSQLRGREGVSLPCPFLMPVGTAELSTSPEHFRAPPSLCGHACAHTHTLTLTPCASQTGCFKQVTKKRQQKHCTSCFENGSFQNAPEIWVQLCVWDLWGNAVYPAQCSEVQQFLCRPTVPSAKPIGFHRQSLSRVSNSGHSH